LEAFDIAAEEARVAAAASADAEAAAKAAKTAADTAEAQRLMSEATLDSSKVGYVGYEQVRERIQNHARLAPGGAQD
jgi:hypothetical protein